MAAVSVKRSIQATEGKEGENEKSEGKGKGKFGTCRDPGFKIQIRDFSVFINSEPETISR